MGRIKKVATERHTATASPFVLEFVQKATAAPLAELTTKLAAFPQHWPFPRGDLYHWIPLLDRFDHILELFNKEYGLVKGPQQEPFESRLLEKGDSEDGMPWSSGGAEFEVQDYSSEGDRELVESVINFTKTLLEHCGNRSLYASSGHLNDLLHTTSQNLLRLVLRLSLRLASRFNVARVKNNHPHAQPILLQNHYNINFDRLQKIAEPFPRPPQSAISVDPTPGKGKEKSTHVPTYIPCDLVAIAKEPKSTVARGDVASVHLTYYEHSTSTSRPGSSHQPSEASPVTPTPVRRTSALGPTRDRPPIGERSATTGDVNATPVKSKEIDSNSPSAPKGYQISCDRISDTPAWALVREAVSKLPADSSYDILNRIRIAKAFATAEASSQMLLETRLLAIANLAYALTEPKFIEKIGTPDHEEPKRFHLAQQLSDLLQPPTNGQAALTPETESAVLLTLEALARCKHKTAEIADALQISHSHGVIYYELRRVIGSLNTEDSEDTKGDRRDAEWRDSVFELTNALLQTNAQARNGDRMVAAGIMSILIEALALLTDRAERYYDRILHFFDSFIHGIPTAFQTLADIKGLDIIADLISHEASTALQNAKNGNVLPAELRSKVVDYDIPFYQQTTLRQLFKFMSHMYDHNAGTHDRLLRNLIDTPQVLGALRNVMENGNIFGSNVWSGAVNIMSSFIHNEPTSFQVVGEAGLVKSLLQTIVPWELKEADQDETKLEDMPIALEYKDGELQYPNPSGVLPVGEAMCEIPTAFGAICLNESGMKLFQSSKALFKFMDIFVSPQHVKAMEEEGQTAASVGQSFDELARHHPQLKEQIMWTVVAMVKRVGEVCRHLAARNGVGTKLWERTPSGIVVSGGRQALAGPDNSSREDGTEPTGAAELGEQAKDNASGVPFISACLKFLDSFFHNTNMCSNFCEQGGVEYLLDLATSASNPYDLVSFPVFNKIMAIVKTMCEAKPHLVLPSLIRRTQQALDGLKPLVDNNNPEGAFATFGDLSKPQISSLPAGTDGTTVVKSLAITHMVTNVLGRALAPPIFTTSRHSHNTNQLFAILDFTDVYIELVNELSQLHAACVWESLILDKATPETLKQPTDPKPYMTRRTDANGVVELAAEVRTDSQANGETANNASMPKLDSQEETFVVKNVRAIRYLLGQAPKGIESFFQSLAHALVPKRANDWSTRQNAALVAENLANALVSELEYEKFDTTDERLKARYTIQIVAACNRTMLRNSTAPAEINAKEVLTLVLNKFYVANGFTKLNEWLQRFSNQLAKLPQKEDALTSPARDGIMAILGFYQYIVRGRLIQEAAQSNSIRSGTDHKQPDYFATGQFVVELRDAILPAVRQLWQSPALEIMGDGPAKTIIDILRTILKGENEGSALKRTDKASRRVRTTTPEFRLRSTEGLRGLTSSGYSMQLSREALYRCNYHETNASEYCRMRQLCEGAPSFPIPSGEPPVEELSSNAAGPSTESANGGIDPPESQPLQRQPSVEMADADETASEHVHLGESVPMPDSEGGDDAESDASADVDVMDDVGAVRISDIPTSDALLQEDLADPVSSPEQRQRLRDAYRASHGPSTGSPPSSKDTHQPFTTIEDLDEKRSELRDELIARCLEVLSAQPTTTFDLAELIQAAVAKTGEGASPRADIGSTLVSSLLSLQGEEPSEEMGAKIAAYAHLVALILQDRDFFDSTLDELKDCFDALVSWIHLGPDQKAENAPWIEMILLIIERVLAEDEQPVEIQWKPPPEDDPLKPLPEPTIPEPVVSGELRFSLFHTVVELLPKIGKHTSLALSVCRVLAILTRHREFALHLSDKHSLSRLFVMVRQLAGSINEKLQGSLMIILRHMVEDEEILGQIMRTEIKTLFENHRSSRPIDSSNYARNLHHLILREPNVFLDATKELVQVTKYDGHPTRPQGLVLKDDALNPESTTSGSEETVANAAPKEPSEEGPTAQPSIEEGSGEAPKQAELKPPTVEITDGVVQFLLRELSNYRDVDEKPSTSPKDKPSTLANGSNGDVDMSDASTSAAQPTSNANDSGNKNDKPTFKAEEHTIYIYRCFIMQCLAEILASYNRTKVEFINFSRKPETQPATPSKPRAGTLNYLLNGLIPVGTLEHRDDIAYRKKLSTSHWATTVIVSLCSKTSELQTPISMRHQDPNEEEYNLTFVRKFVLEHALRAFKEASVSTEPLDQKYSRLLGLSELFNRMLTSKADRATASFAYTSYRHIGKLMFEKGFVGAMTSAIADLDLNFPNSKRAVKYILGPLKQLTDLGIALSQSSDLSSSATGTTDEEEISSATSVSDDEDDEREQTPDLYRNSTLGMFESSADHDEDSETDSEDEDDDEMFDDEYGDEMDYEEEPIRDHDEVISDEDDEDIEGMDDIGEIEGVPGDVDIDIDVVMDHHHDDDETVSDESSEDDDGDDDDEGDDVDEFANEMDEILGDDNASMPGVGEDIDWEEDLGHAGADGGSPHGGPLVPIPQAMASDERSDDGEGNGVVHIDMGDGEEEFFEDELPPEAEDDDEEDEVDYENDVVYEPEFEEEDDDDEQEMRWDWDVPPPPAVMRGGHLHHHHHRPQFEMFGMIGGDSFRAPGLRTHRPTANPRGEDDGTNPLLQRDGTAAGNNRRDPELPARRGLLARHGEFLHNLVEAVGPNGGHHTINVNIDPRFHGGFAPVMALEGRHGRALLDIDPSRPWREQLGLPGGLPRITDILPSHRSRELRTSPSSDEAQAVEFRPIATTVRWQEEARMLFSGKHQEKATRILNSLLRLLVPAAMEAKKQRDKAEKERRAAEAKAREEEEKRKAAEKAEEDARLQKEKEERDAKEAEEAAERARLAEENTGADGQTADETEATSMEGVVQSEAAESSTNAQQEEAATDAPPAERVTMTIRGREFDITHLGIDLEFLQELPEELREEVVMTQVAEQRAQAQAQATQTGEQGTGISREFLDALPPDIQRELLRQEEVDRRRAQQEEARHRAAEDGNAPAAQAEEMNNADLFAMLEPNLRRTILMDSDENQIAALPEHLQAEARSLHPPNFHRRAEPFLHQRRPGEQPRSAIDRALDRAEHAREGSRQRRPVIQMLDKAGIATLLRLMFVSLPQKAKNNLHSILADVCKNTQNRAEVISILLSILQDGTADVAAVERSFAALSLRAKQQSAPKTPQLLKRTATGTVVTPSAELSPLNIVLACLGTLNALTTENPRVSQFFLTEHDSVVSSKIRSAKKGKGKEVRAAKFPLNALLGLLDRKLITENTGVMETLASLLNRVTAPLHTLARRAKEAEEAEKARAEAAAKPTTEATTEVTTEATAETPAPAGADVQMEEAANAEVPSTTTAAAAETTAADAPTSTNEGASTEDQANEASKQEEPKNEDKKAREPVPPEVPEENIRLVVNIMTARECPSKTFVDTLDVIRNLSGIPGAKEIFGKELARQAQGLSESVLADLEDLAKQMDSAQTETDLQGLALANFSSATAKPTKLLRVIVAIDYLFNPRSNDTSGLEPKLKEDILAVLYESSTFDKLWSKLSQCLTAIRVRGNMINVATILLPLIESLMVVCRNTSLNEPVADPTSPQITVSSPAPESRLESLFFSFTEEHRKILNELIRNNPKLMNNNFDVLAKNSKVLEFDNKRSYFNRKVHTRVDRTPHPSLQLSVRRDHVFLDSFKSLYYKNGNEIKYGKLNIRFHGEEGIDAGGVSREWFAAMARQMFNPDYALFNPVASDRTTFHPNPLSEINDEHLMFFKFIGRIIGKALYEGRVLDCHFSRAVYRRILGKSVSLKDMESLDLDYYKSLVWILENDITDITFETFSVDIDRFGVVETVDLIPDGQNIPVTEENKHEYVRLVVEHRLIKSIEKQLTEFLKGFHEIIPSELISIFNEQELELLISGLPEIDVDDWKNNTEYQNYQPTSPQIQWFWRAVRSFDKEEKAKLLQFVTGTSKVPLNGFKELEGMNGFARFNIHRDYSNKEKLPSSHTCFNQLDLPEYESYEHLRQQLYTAITAGSEYFGFA